MIFKGLLKKRETASERLYGAIVAAGRHPLPYSDWGVPDTVSGRFDMICLYLFLVLDRLKGGNDAFRQDLIDTFFDDMDRSLREMGVGDLSVGKKVRKMAESFYGRVSAYGAALADGEEALRAALSRNIYPEGGPVEGSHRLASHVMRVCTALRQQSESAIVDGTVSFPEPQE